MGNAYSDDHVNMNIELNKGAYMTGEFIEGSVKIVARTDLPYQTLRLKLQVLEYCQWNRHAPNTIFHDIRYYDFAAHNIVYSQSYVLSQFPRGLTMGYYVFPFAVRIPSDLPGTIVSQYAAITYCISSNLGFSIETIQTKVNAYSIVSVTEPARFAPSVITVMGRAHPKTRCCASLGESRLSVIYSTNVAKSGDTLTVNIVTDNRECKVDVLATKLSLISNAYMSNDTGKKQHVKGVVCQKIVKGRVSSQCTDIAQATIQIPPEIPCSTAIGFAVANFYTLQVSSQLQKECGSSREGPRTRQHIYIRALKPVFEINQTSSVLPPDEQPTVAARVSFAEPSLAGFRVNPLIQAMNRDCPPITY